MREMHNKTIMNCPQKDVGWTRKKPRASYGKRYVFERDL